MEESSSYDASAEGQNSFRQRLGYYSFSEREIAQENKEFSYSAEFFNDPFLFGNEHEPLLYFEDDVQLIRAKPRNLQPTSPVNEESTPNLQPTDTFDKEQARDLQLTNQVDEELSRSLQPINIVDEEPSRDHQPTNIADEETTRKSKGMNTVDEESTRNRQPKEAIKEGSARKRQRTKTVKKESTRKRRRTNTKKRKSTASSQEPTNTIELDPTRIMLHPKHQFYFHPNSNKELTWRGETRGLIMTKEEFMAVCPNGRERVKGKSCPFKVATDNRRGASERAAIDPSGSALRTMRVEYWQEDHLWQIRETTTSQPPTLYRSRKMMGPESAVYMTRSRNADGTRTSWAYVQPPKTLPDEFIGVIGNRAYIATDSEVVVTGLQDDEKKNEPTPDKSKSHPAEPILELASQQPTNPEAATRVSKRRSGGAVRTRAMTLRGDADIENSFKEEAVQNQDAPGKNLARKLLADLNGKDNELRNKKKKKH